MKTVENWYRVYYVGNDSCNHKVAVRAVDHSEAADKVKREYGADMITGVKSISPPFANDLVLIVVVVVVLILIIVQCAKS